MIINAEEKKMLTFFIPNLKGGGAERVAANFVNSLSRDFDVNLILIEETVDYEISEKINKVVLFKKTPYLLKFVSIPFFSYKLYRYVKQNNIDKIFSMMSYANWITLYMRQFGWPGQIILSEQASPFDVSARNKIKEKIRIFLFKKLYPKADLIIPCSKYLQFQLENVLKIDGKYHFLYNPLNIPDGLEKMNRETPATYHTFTFVNVAAFRAEKNHLLLIEAFSLVKNKNCQLVLVGRGVNDGVQHAIKKMITSKGLQDRIIFTGFTNNPYKYLYKADCFVLSSDREGLPNVILEALLCGLPVISTDCRTGPREILAPETDFTYQCAAVEKTAYGFLTPVKNAADLAVAMELQMQNMAGNKYDKAASTARAMDFDLKLISKELVELIR